MQRTIKNIPIVTCRKQLFALLRTANNFPEGRPLHPSLAIPQQIVFSSTGKVPNRNKNNSSIKPNKFHSKYVCFCGRKTRDERKLCLKIDLFGFPQRLVTGLATTETRKMVSASTLIGPFEFDRALATRPLLTCDRAVNFTTFGNKR